MAPQPGPRISLPTKESEGQEFEHFPAVRKNAFSVTLQRIRVGGASRKPALIDQSSLFSNILPQQFEEIRIMARKQEFVRGQTIHFQDDPDRQVVLLTSGSAKVVQSCQNGLEVILRLCGPGELVGTLRVSRQGRHSSTAQTLQRSEALVWDAGVFEGFLRRFPVLRLNATHILDEQLRDMEDRFLEISTELVATRLSRQIIRLAKHADHQGSSMEICISREELAQLVGTTMFSVSRLLSDWNKRGILRTRRQGVSVQDLKALEDLSNNANQLRLSQ